MIVVEQQAAGQNVGGRRIRLELDQVASAEQVIGVGPLRKLLDVDVVVLHLESVEEPGSVAHQRPGKGEPGNEFVKSDSIDVLE